MRRAMVVLTLFVLSLSLLSAATVPGKVVGLDGKPIADVQLLLSLNGLRSVQQLSAGKDGRFTLDLDLARLQRRAAPRGYVLAVAPGYVLAGIPVNYHETCIRLNDGVRLRGTVTDQAGMPLTGVAVRMQSLKDTDLDSNLVTVPLAWCERFTAVSAADGRWTLPDVPQNGRVTIVISDDRYAFKSKEVIMTDGEPTEPVQLVGVSGATLRGRVHLPDGIPASDAEVELLALNYMYDTRVTLSPDGSYRFQGLLPGNYVLAVSSSSNAWITERLNAIAVREGAETVVPDVQARSGAVLEGDVLDANSGTPLADARIACYVGDKVASHAMRAYLTTDLHGHFSSHLVPEKMTLLVLDPPRGYLRQRNTEAVSIELQEGTTSHVTLKLQQGHTVTGTVTDTQGTPVMGVDLLLGVSPGDGTQRSPNDRRVRIVTDEHGAFTCYGLPPGRGTLSVYQDVNNAHAWETPVQLQFTVPAPEPMHITLRRLPLNHVSGRVVDDRHQPLRGATLIFEVSNEEQHGRQTMATRTGDDGTYQLEPFSSGTTLALLSLRKPGYRYLGNSVSITAEQVKPDELVMTACDATVHGVVRTPAGTPVAGAVVVSAEGGVAQRAVSDSTGAFTLTQQPHGELHLVTATATGGGVATAITGHDVVMTCTPGLRTKPGDVPLALSLLAADAKAPQARRLFTPSSTIRAIADVDLPLALKMAAAPDVHPSQGLRAYLLGKLAATNPEEAAKVGVAQLDLITDDACRFYAAVELGIATRQCAANVSEHCYAIAKGIYDRLHDAAIPSEIEDLDYFDKLMVGIVSLVGYLQKTADIDAMLVQLNTSIAQDDDPYSIIRSLLQAAGRVSPEFALMVYDRLNDRDKESQVACTLMGLAYDHPSEVPRLVQMIADHVTEFQDVHRYDLLETVDLLGKADPAAARALAEKLLVCYPEAMLVAARYQPKEAATKIMWDCFADEQQLTVENLARAIAVDPEFAATLYQQYRKRFAVNALECQTNTAGQPNSDYLFYAYMLANIDPVEARLIMETEYAHYRATAHSAEEEAELMIFPVMMTSIDLTRARALFESLPACAKFRLPFGRYIMRYILGSQVERATTLPY